MMMRPLMLRDPFNNAATYIWLGTRELFKYRRFLLSYFGVTLFLSLVISFVATELDFDGWPKVASWYFRLITDAIAASADVLVIQFILGKYRAISINGRILGLCLLWAASFLVVSALLAYLILYLGKFAPNVTGYKQHVLADQIHRLLREIALAAIMVWFGFYPFLLLEGARKPVRESVKLIRKCGFALAICWILVWFICAAMRNIAKYGVLIMLAKSGFLEQGNYTGLFIFETQDFLMYVLLILLPPAITTAAYLRETREYNFLKRDKLPPLFKADSPVP